jgi:hypothetical protein
VADTAIIVTDPAAFRDWWQRRGHERDDPAIVNAAIEAGLITRVDRLIWLTPSGKDKFAEGSHG